MTARAIALSLLLALVTAAASDAAARKQPCEPRGSRTLARSDQGRIYADGAIVWGCLFRTGDAYPLAEYGQHVGEDYSRVPIVRLRGRYAAVYVHNEFYGQTDVSVTVTNLTNGRNPHEWVDGGGTESCRERWQVGSLRLNARGSVGWIVRRVDSCDARELPNTWVHKADTTRRGRVLDEGKWIEPRSLTLRDGWLRWRNDGVVRRARLR